MNSISRRMFGRLAGSTAGLFSLPFRTLAAPPIAESTDRLFPPGFLWGSATASYQVEGAVNEDGRGQSIWDTFSHTPGKTHHGDTGDVADDSYHRYKDDVALMKQLGLATCRFSVAWSRVFPSGRGAANPKGLDFYHRLVDELLKNGIAPYCTLYHWDLPQTLEDEGGWQNRATAQAFADYAGYTAGKLSDRVNHFMTMNEMSSFIENGYGTGFHAPGLSLPLSKLAQARHHAVLGHGLAVEAIRASARAGTKVGLAENASPCLPAIETKADIEAAHKAMPEQNARYLTVILEGRYTDHYLAQLGAAAPKFTPAELKTIGSPVDFVGLNIYTPEYVRADDGPLGYRMVPMPGSYPHMASPWLTIGPEALYWVPKIAARVWNLREIYVTENGASSDDVPNAKGEILDVDRVMYLRNCLTHLQRSVEEGVPVKGYFCWSLLDNYEWADGYDKRFGITYVDFKTQKRTPKLSSEFYREVIRRNGLG